MKKVCIGKVILFSAFVFSASFMGCNSGGQIGITQDGNTANTPSSQANPASAGQATKSQAPPEGINPFTIVFEQVRARDGMLPIINGLGFLARDAQLDSPYVMDIKNEIEIAAIEPFFPVSGGILVAGISANDASLDLIDTATLATSSLMSVTGITSYSSTSDGSVIGWTTQDGSAFVSQTPFAAKVQLDLKGSDAVKIVSRGSTPIFYVTTNSARAQTLAFKFPSPKAMDTFAAKDIALSPSGNHVLLVNDPSKLQVYNALDHTTTRIAGTYDVHEAAWRDEETVSFWSKSGGAVSIQTLDTVKGGTEFIANLDEHVSTGNISCPRWSGGELYFADYRDSNYSIFRAANTSGVWKVSEFAASDDSRFGYICPYPEN